MVALVSNAQLCKVAEWRARRYSKGMSLRRRGRSRAPWLRRLGWLRLPVLTAVFVVVVVWAVREALRPGPWQRVYATREGLVGRRDGQRRDHPAGGAVRCAPHRSALRRDVELRYQGRDLVVPVLDVGPRGTRRRLLERRAAAGGGARAGDVSQAGEPGRHRPVRRDVRFAGAAQQRLRRVAALRPATSRCRGWPSAGDEAAHLGQHAGGLLLVWPVPGVGQLDHRRVGQRLAPARELVGTEGGVLHAPDDQRGHGREPARAAARGRRRSRRTEQRAGQRPQHALAAVGVGEQRPGTGGGWRGSACGDRRTRWA